ncbi:hypothetical protein ASPSYDRAFT_86351 [Aspergillus sydowii CBS 593.65]|uniref:Uncharacterized protein n=1 Tax=Aspergillus sydowii CBS 593.65 TaxID=1036612 RepID=A0A1L9TT99_9EURO|nr:uncharacterized protein ASPSYDRAFT_86351 [Aspergillus sydowii CBS 593.65]OJJ62686.1 hypothetical protein ASPSYDRAFT_86351 [Aspergillus sydowii CBS 593.65]
MTTQSKQMIDWSDMKSIQREFTRRKANTDSPICSQEELEVFLKGWMVKNWKGELGDVQPLWQLISTQNLLRPRCLLLKLAQIRYHQGHGAELQLHNNVNLQRLPPLATSIEKLLEEGETAALKWKVEVIFHAFLLMREIDGIGIECELPLFENAEKPSPRALLTDATFAGYLLHLASPETKRLCLHGTPMHEETASDLNNLWDILRDSPYIAVRHSFRRAVQGEKRNWWYEGGPWHEFGRIFESVLENAEPLICEARGYVARIFEEFYAQFTEKPDALGITWTKGELNELGKVYYGRVCRTAGDIEGHLSGYRDNPASAVASVLPIISPEDIVHHHKPPPTVSQSKNIHAINGKACWISVCVVAISSLGILVLQRAVKDGSGGEWEPPSGEVEAGYQVCQGGQRVLFAQTSIESQVRIVSSRERANSHQLWYDFKGFANVPRSLGSGPLIRLTGEHQDFAWSNGEPDLARDKHIGELLAECDCIKIASCSEI